MSSGITEQEFHRFSVWLRNTSGISLAEEKAYLVETRLLKLMLSHGCKSYADLLGLLENNTVFGLREKVVDAMTTNETLWFRDRHPFAILRELFLSEVTRPEYSRERKVRIWSAASSTGQEAYSIAISILEEARRNPAIQPQRFEIVATDISTNVLKIAEAGRFDQLAMTRGMPRELRERYFRQDGHTWVVDEAVRNLVTFRKFNLLERPQLLGRFQMIFIRYVLIYFTIECKREIVSRFREVLTSPAFLVLGATETLRGVAEDYRPNQHAGGTYYIKS